MSLLMMTIKMTSASNLAQMTGQDIWTTHMVSPSLKFKLNSEPELLKLRHWTFSHQILSLSMGQDSAQKLETEHQYLTTRLHMDLIMISHAQLIADLSWPEEKAWSKIFLQLIWMYKTKMVKVINFSLVHVQDLKEKALTSFLNQDRRFYGRAHQVEEIITCTTAYATDSYLTLYSFFND